MESLTHKIKRNLKEGSLIKNGTRALRKRLITQIHTSNWIYFFDKYRIQTKKYQSDITPLGSNGIKAGNYYIDKRILVDNKSVVYSLGILTDITFDLFMSETYGCEVFMYDPTPESVSFMKRWKNTPGLNFNPIGVWTENKTLRFYRPSIGASASTINVDTNSDDYFEAECLSMKTIMKHNAHSNITIFKADIEGAALPILLQMTEQGILPDQIIAEFERPKLDKQKIEQFFDDLSKLRNDLRNIGYEEYLLPRKKAKYFSLELLFVNRNKFVDAEAMKL